MRSILKSLALLIITAVCLSSCGYNQKQQVVLKYVNEQMAELVDVEAAVIDGYNSVTGDNYIDDWTLYDALNEYIINDSKNLVEMAEAISPEDPELREIHEKYISAINEQHQAFLMILSALETQDYSVVAQANDRLTNARKGIRDYIAALDSLMAKHKIEFLETTE